MQSGSGDKKRQMKVGYLIHLKKKNKTRKLDKVKTNKQSKCTVRYRLPSVAEVF